MKDYLKRYVQIIQNKDEESLAWQSFPGQLQHTLKHADHANDRLRAILDYVSGMTDNYFIEEATLFHDLKRGRAVVLQR